MLQLLFYYSLSLTAISSLSSFLSLFCVSLFFVTFLSVLCTPKPPKYCCCIYYSLFIIIQYSFFIIFLSYYHNYSYLSSFFLNFFHYFLPERPYYCCYSYYLSFIITYYYFIIIIIITIPLFFLTISVFFFTFCIPKRLSYCCSYYLLFIIIYYHLIIIFHSYYPLLSILFTFISIFPSFSSCSVYVYLGQGARRREGSWQRATSKKHLLEYTFPCWSHCGTSLAWRGQNRGQFWPPHSENVTTVS